MSTIKHGEVGTLDTAGEVLWNEAQDVQYYKDIHGKDEGSTERREYMVRRIESNLVDYVETLDRAIGFLCKHPQSLDTDVLALLSIDGKIALLRRLTLEQSNKIPVERRMAYLARFEEAFERYEQAEKIRDKVLCRYLLEGSKTWLREFVDAADDILAAWFGFEEVMSCEHEGYVRLHELHRS